ncbi:4-(cytidine 5'-diphospho)-2-C-methyl-D-erythritol kinase [Alkalilimnicola sp. S0819]|uniref:4-(cytidine 5'-diphospho)-2-C-methyl-D-erythritol kinase n=1 Tax=Alkalilimnicola sp. S0819 TaxID=2613922 RepID=UPI0012621BD9|nr:4-(cytidine 5'-diphospho)-2-C-methyl-D-erythritol kinase [Alkalilimnicola sp. S0819]KAB7623786.1 4-(cytidine 5'-diphospho)-2-C-methyl-D-erythritol kinase [Alkalilimnicola sp. S0819]MPQ16659.1 4-(cytidine 5'-diphospho)-2-C-methyl-D-erythritol kinase [Alkalilimnicola sp. S0819]
MAGPESVGWPAPAKLNLFLHVCARRADGYHELQTVFQLLDHGDELDFVPRGDGAIRRSAGPEAVPPEEDLVVRAARLLQAQAGIRQGVDIRVRKRLPLGGGLGGGSSDAATTLVALNALWGAELSTEELATLGLRLGADVPVFVRGESAFAEGVGERLQPLALPEQWFLVIAPAVSVSTAEVFTAPELTRDTPRIKIPPLEFHRCRNDCEPVVRTRYPPVARALDWLSSHAPARLTGTGGCVFAPFAARARAEAVLATLPAGWQGFVARGLQRSPLRARLAVERVRKDNWGVAKR